MLDVLTALGYRKLVVCHLNHRTRGRASAADARFVRSLARRCQLEADIGVTDVPRLAKADGLSLETAARLARHRFFFAAAARHRCRRVVLAHHGDDQVESVLMHLFRGCGVGGLGGMRELTRLHPPGGAAARSPLELIRPLLSIRRAEIDAHLGARKLKWREDASNDSADHLRNRVRAELLPQLSDVFRRDVAPIVQRLGQIAGEDDACLEQLAGKALAEATVTAAGSLPTSALTALHPALQRRVIRGWLGERGVDGVGFAAIESVRALLAAARPAKTNLPDGRHARRRAGRLFVE